MAASLLACAAAISGKIKFADFTEILSAGTDVIHAARDYGLALSLETWDKAARTQEWCQSQNAQILYPGHADYPCALFLLEQPPLFLSYQGTPSWKDYTPISIVGSREPLQQSLRWMELFLPRFFRKEQVSVISGGARGIDQKAHALSIQAGRPTLAFLPSGLKNIYPSDFRHWIPGILESGGAILSEFAPDEKMWRGNFERRNRVIAALAPLVLVVEARRRSGSTMTARLAGEIGRTICALPSSPMQAQTLGTLDLLVNGAMPVRDDIDLELIFRLSAKLGADSRPLQS